MQNILELDYLELEFEYEVIKQEADAAIALAWENIKERGYN